MRLFFLCLFTMMAACQAKPANGPSLVDLHTNFQTVITESKSKQRYTTVTPRPARKITYTSDDMKMTGWLLSKGAMLRGSKRPALVYLHGGFALGAEDMIEVQPFINAGYVVLLPALRGENGNPGSFELFAGEVRDANAAGKWLARQPGIAPDNISLIGHSVGGGIAILASMLPDTPYRQVASINGFYPQDTCEDLKSAWGASYDPKRENECAMRFPDTHWNELQIPLTGYVGLSDIYSAKASAFFKSQIDNNPNITFTNVVGDHRGAVANAMPEFLKLLTENVGLLAE